MGRNQGFGESRQRPHHVLIGETTSHFDNHFLTSGAKEKLLELAYLYKMIWFPFNPLLHVNDASLERGGLLDISETWLPPHYEHRRGTVVDIRANLAPGGIPGVDLEEFMQLAKVNNIFAKLETKYDSSGNELTVHRHFHLRLEGKAE